MEDYDHSSSSSSSGNGNAYEGTGWVTYMEEEWAEWRKQENIKKPAIKKPHNQPQRKKHGGGKKK